MRPTTLTDWPFLYLRDPMVPDLSLRGVAIMWADWPAGLLFGLFWRGALEPAGGASMAACSSSAPASC